MNGNPYKLLYGDMKDLIKIMKAEQPKSINLSDDMIPHILPYYHQTINKYGKSSFIWFGPSPRLNIADPELIKEILMKPSMFQKPGPDIIGQTILGGLLFLRMRNGLNIGKLSIPPFILTSLKNDYDVSNVFELFNDDGEMGILSLLRSTFTTSGCVAIFRRLVR